MFGSAARCWLEHLAMFGQQQSCRKICFESRLDQKAMKDTLPKESFLKQWLLGNRMRVASLAEYR
jgi:hypothetical protein